MLPSPAAGPLWAAPQVRGAGDPQPLPSSGCSSTLQGPKPETCILWVQLQLRWFQKGGKGSILQAVASLCDTHYRNDCVFSLITHYFYAERRLNEGKKKKNNSNNTSREQLTHTQNTLLFVWNSPVCKRRPVNTPLHCVTRVRGGSFFRNPFSPGSCLVFWVVCN